jgi:hypothetical protein
MFGVTELYMEFENIVTIECINYNVKRYGIAWTYEMLKDIKRKL